MDYLSLRKKNIMNYEKERKIREIIKEDLNNICIDCNNEKPEYISLNNAVFICKICFRNHQKFSSNISKTIKNNLKSLTLKELQYLYFGGNKKMLEFMKYEYPKLIKLNSSFVYKTIAMEYYRNWLSYLVEGGNKPIKPDIEIAYKSIEDKIYSNNKYSTNNNSDVITIDFINDCYNYNDNNNNCITNFINKNNKERGALENNNNNINNNNINSKYQTEKIFYRKNGTSGNLKDFLNYYKNINKNNYEKYVNNQSNDFFSKTQTNFINNRNKSINEDNSYIDNKNKINSKYNNSIEEINNYDILNNENNQNNYNNKMLKAFKTNNKIYIKPKHAFIKSFDKEPNIEQSNIKHYENNLITNNNKNNNENGIRNFIRVKRDSNKIDFEKENKNINDDDNNNENNIDKSNNEFLVFNNKNMIRVCGARSRYTKKRFSNNFINLNKTVEEKEKKENEEKDKDDKNITQDFIETNNTKSNNNESYINNNSSLNNIIFKKKNFKKSYYSNNDKKHNKISSNIDHSQLEIISKNAIDTTRDDGKSYEESYDDTQNSIQTLPSNKSLRQFYSRHPRKMNRTKTKRRKLNESKKEEKKEKTKYNKLKREKSEIIHSLKLLLKKKEQIKNNENKKEEDNDNDNSEDYNYKYKTIDNDKRKKIFVNKIKNDELKKIIINENRKYRKDSNNNDENIENKEEEDKKNNININEQLQRKKIYVKQNEEFLQKGDINSIRYKYKNRRYKINSDL